MRTGRAVAAAPLAALLLVALAAPAFALPKSQATPARGEWTWLNETFSEKVHDKGTAYLRGDETGTWTGTFVGDPHDDFIGHVDATGQLHGTLSVDFENVTVDGAVGGLKMRLSWYANDSYFGGQWKIVAGSGELRHLRGEGEWLRSEDVGVEGGARYSDMIWEL